ncbi:hypothetical protein GALMADRAFT_139586 [Galerina marginata CBS 339.88]|uniref:Cyanovirin-N domain-containing protein n=1 Tax=Galerina marginata (strain CBS 339.88) TaxID=685588 RepID=A0A067T9U9_GALM3|nr:hypothetical protein GALMADRAFT_139586 [Galerina marginata CBS 339.88]
MKTIILPTILAIAMHITLTTGYVATVYKGSSCNVHNPQNPSFSIVGLRLAATKTGCIAPSVPLDKGSFSLTGCSTGGSASIFSDTACKKLLKTIHSAGTACADSLAVGSFIIKGC